MGEPPIIHTDDPEKILSGICDYYGVQKKILISKSRKADLVYARAVVCHIARAKFGMTFQSIGKLIGNRDHATVIHLLKLLAKKVSEKETIKSDVEHAVSYCEKIMGISDIDLIDLKIAELIAKRAKLV